MTTQPDGSLDEFKDPLSLYEPDEYETELERVLAEEPVSAITSQPCIRIEASLPISEAVRMLQDAQVSSLLVVENDQLVGIITERDVLERVADQFTQVASDPVSSVMTSDPLVIYDNDSSATALAAIAGAGYRHVPVLNAEGKIVGIVSPRRVFTFLQSKVDTGQE